MTMADDITQRHYAKRDHMAQGDYYTRHVSAMTGEDLHRKSAIAAELAHRDMLVDTLRARVAELEAEVQRLRAALCLFMSAGFGNSTDHQMQRAAIDAASAAERKDG